MRGRPAWVFIIALVYFGMFLPRPLPFAGGGWNEKSRFALTRAIVEHRSLRIDPYERGTGDKAFFEGHYYSDKAPGLSLFAVPVYALIYSFERLVGSRRLQAIDPPDVINLWLVTLITVSVPCALGAALFYQLCTKWTTSPASSFFATLVLIYASPYSFYASIFVGHGLAAAIAIGITYLMLRKEEPSHREFFFAGLLAGACILTEYPLALFALISLVYILWKWRSLSKTGAFVAGMVPGLLVLALYLTLAFGSPFRLGYTLEARPEFAEIHRAPLLGFSFPSLTALLGITLSPFRGIFFFCPILIFGILGLLPRFRSAPSIFPSSFFGVLIASYLLANAAYPVWDGGDLPLARHALLAVPYIGFGVSLWGSQFRSLPVRWLFLLSAFNVFILRLNVYHSVAYLNPLFDLALPNLWSNYVLPTVASLFLLPGITAIAPHVAAAVVVTIFGARRLM